MQRFVRSVVAAAVLSLCAAAAHAATPEWITQSNANAQALLGL